MRYVPLAVRLKRRSKVNRKTGCRVFQGATVRGGYGLISNERGASPRFVFAHRAAYELEHGPIPEGMKVLHSCDNPPCIAVKHLFLGTHDDNMADMAEKDRRKAPSNTKSRVYLTDDQRLDIFYRLKAGETVLGLAREFDVDRKTIRNVRDALTSTIEKE